MDFGIDICQSFVKAIKLGIELYTFWLKIESEILEYKEVFLTAVKKTLLLRIKKRYNTN